DHCSPPRDGSSATGSSFSVGFVRVRRVGYLGPAGPRAPLLADRRPSFNTTLNVRVVEKP
ncbi:MAG: hypothetical protein ACC645_03465, partial [Pirellulales bacterium]